MKKFLLNKMNFDIFLTLFLSYLLVVIIPIAAIGIFCSQASRQIYDDIYTSRQNRTEQIGSLIDVRFLDFENCIYKIMIEYNALDSESTEDSSADIRFRNFQFQKSMNRLGVLNDVVWGYYVLDFRKNLVFTDSGVYTVPDFENSMLSSLGYGAGYFENELLNTERINIQKAPSGDIICYAPFSSRVDGNMDSMVVLAVDTGWINRICSRYIAENEGPFTVSLGGNVIFSSSENFSREDSESFVAFSSINGIEYTLLSERGALLRSYTNINIVMLVCLTLLVLFVSLSAVKYARGLSLKVAEIIRGVVAFSGGKNKKRHFFKVIEEGVTGVVENYRLLDNIMENQSPLVQTSVFRSIVEGRLERNSDIEKMLVENGIIREAANYVLIICDLAGSKKRGDEIDIKELSYISGAVKIIMEQTFGICSCVMNVNVSRLAAVLCFDGRFSEEDCRSLSKQAADVAANEAMSYIGTEIRFALAGPFEKASYIVEMYRQASYVAEYNSVREPSFSADFDKVLWYDEIERSNRNFEYPVEREQQIINMTLLGNEELLHDTLTSLYKENIISKQLSDDAALQFANAVRVTANRAAAKLERGGAIVKSLIELNTARKPEEIIKYANDVLGKICSEMGKSSDKNIYYLADKAIEYITENISNPDLNADMTAAALNVSGKYLSYCVKEITSQSISSYIERMRIEYAADLLKNSNMTILNISEEVGYRSDKSFRRAFKNNTGVSPTDYRKR